MGSDFDHVVQIPWTHIGEALQVMESMAGGSYRAVPIGNRVVIECAQAHDALKLAAMFNGAKLLKGSDPGQ